MVPSNHWHTLSRWSTRRRSCRAHVHGLAVESGKGDVRRVRETLRTQPVHDHADVRIAQQLFETIAQRRHPRGASRITLPDLQRMVQAHGQFNRFRARPQAHLLETTEHPWFELSGAGSAARDTARTVKLVARDGERGHLQLREMDRDLADRLDCIRVKRHPQLAATTGQRRDGLQHARFVVGQHDAHQPRRRREQLAK